MKKNYLFLLTLLTVFVSSFVYADGLLGNNSPKETFESYVKAIDYEDDKLYITLEYTSSNVMAYMFDIKYDSNYLTFDDVITNDNINVTNSNVDKKNKYETKTLLFDSEYAYTQIPFAKISFKVNENYKIGSQTLISILNREATGASLKLFKPNDQEITIKRSEEDKFIYVEKDINILIKIQRFISDYYIFIIIIFILLFLLSITNKIIEKISSKKPKEYYNDNISFKNDAQPEIKNPLINDTKDKLTFDEIMADPDKKNRIKIIILLLITISLNTSAYNVEEVDIIRNSIIKHEYVEKYDYTGDKKLDLRDLVYAIGNVDVLIFKIDKFNESKSSYVTFGTYDDNRNYITIETYNDINYNELIHIEFDVEDGRDNIICDNGVVSNLTRVRNNGIVHFSFDYETPTNDSCILK